MCKFLGGFHSYINQGSPSLDITFTSYDFLLSFIVLCYSDVIKIEEPLGMKGYQGADLLLFW
jgi:hypothetical protein